MRMTTMVSVALLAASTAALAQVASTPVEQKTGQPGTDANATQPVNDMTPVSNALAPGNTAAPIGTLPPKR